LWHFEARDFVAIVTMDSHGNSLHEDVAAATGSELAKVGTRGRKQELGVGKF